MQIPQGCRTCGQKGVAKVRRAGVSMRDTRLQGQAAHLGGEPWEGACLCHCYFCLKSNHIMSSLHYFLGLLSFMASISFHWIIAIYRLFRRLYLILKVDLI